MGAWGDVIAGGEGRRGSEVPAGGNQGGRPLGSLGPEGTPERVGRDMNSRNITDRNSSIWRSVAKGLRNPGCAEVICIIVSEVDRLWEQEQDHWCCPHASSGEREWSEQADVCFDLLCFLCYPEDLE